MGLRVETQVSVPLVFRGVKLGKPRRPDVLVEDMVIVGIKAVGVVHDAEGGKLPSYLRLSDRRLGLIINFHEPRLKDGIRRVVNGLQE